MHLVNDNYNSNLDKLLVTKNRVAIKTTLLWLPQLGSNQ